MRKLISANFFRIRRDKIFWICIVSILAYAIVYMLNGARQATNDLTEFNYTLDNYYFHFAISIGAFISVFSSLFFGTEYSDGTIRNKMIVGHTRAEIYLSNLICTFVVAMIMLFTWIIGALAGVPALGFWKMGVGQLLTYLCIATLFIAALCAIFALINSLSTNKALTVIISIGVFMALLIFAFMISSSLSQPEMVSGVVITNNGMSMGEPSPNPNYISGMKRTVYEFISDFLPTGQGAQIAFNNIDNPVRMMLSSVFITVSVTLCGIATFRKKNIK